MTAITADTIVHSEPGRSLDEATSLPVDDKSARVLSSLLGYAGLSADASETATKLLQCFGSLGAVMRAPADALARDFQLPFSVVAAIAAVLAVHRAAMRERLPKRLRIASDSALRAFLADELRHRREEVLLGLFLDNDFHLIAVEEIATGSVAHCPVTVRQIVERSLARGASAMILAHNHPSGRIEPSEADVTMTRTLQQTLASVDVELVEHVVVGDGLYSILRDQAYA